MNNNRLLDDFFLAFIVVLGLAVIALITLSIFSVRSFVVFRKLKKNPQESKVNKTLVNVRVLSAIATMYATVYAVYKDIKIDDNGYSGELALKPFFICSLVLVISTLVSYRIGRKDR